MADQINQKIIILIGLAISILMIASYIKMLTSRANFTNIYRGTYEISRVAASVSRSLLLFR